MEQSEDGTSLVPTPKVTYREGPGRPTNCTPQVIKVAARLHAIGLTMPVLCQATGIPFQTVLEWNRKGKDDIAAGVDSPFAQWWQAMEEAKGAFEANMVRTVVAGAVTDWKAAAWILERRVAQRWGKPEHRLPREAKDDLSTMSTSDLRKVASGEMVPKGLAETVAAEEEEPDEDELTAEDETKPPPIDC